MLLTESGMLTAVRELQLKNAYNPILVTEFGMVMDFRQVQLKNTRLPMVVTPELITTEVMGDLFK